MWSGRRRLRESSVTVTGTSGGKENKKKGIVYAFKKNTQKGKVYAFKRKIQKRKLYACIEIIKQEPSELAAQRHYPQIVTVVSLFPELVNWSICAGCHVLSLLLSAAEDQSLTQYTGPTML